MRERASEAGKARSDSSLIALTLSNILTIGIALYEGWDVAAVIVVYWAQSVLIGVMTVIRMLDMPMEAMLRGKGKAKAGSPDEMVQLGGMAPEKAFGYAKAFIAGFFCIHYGMFHYGYYQFINPPRVLSMLWQADQGAYWSLIGAILLFGANHAFSFIRNREKDRKEANLAALMFGPYHRIAPMHVTIIFGSMLAMALEFAGYGANRPVLLFFLIVKTYADRQAHTAGHIFKAKTR